MEQRDFTHRKLSHLLKQVYISKGALEKDHKSKQMLLDFIINNFVKFCCLRCSTFQKYFNGIYFSGSYFEGLRVYKATEFDVDVIFTLPKNLSYKVSELDEMPSFATFKLFERSNLQDFADCEQYIKPKLLLEWFQSLLDSFSNQFDVGYPGLSEIRVSHSGPARTLKLFYECEWISVDLVPVISFDASLLEKYTLQHVINFSEESMKFCFLVPKPLKSDLSSLLVFESFERVWRIHLPEVEKNIIRPQNSVKQLIKLIKCLRDQEKWPICSYFIKVMAFWLLKTYPDSKIWKSSQLGLPFMMFLESMKQHLEAKFLSHILYPNFNLFHSLSDRTMFDLKGRIQSIISMIEENPKNILRLYNMPILMPCIRSL